MARPDLLVACVLRPLRSSKLEIGSATRTRFQIYPIEMQGQNSSPCSPSTINVCRGGRQREEEATPSEKFSRERLKDQITNMEGTVFTPSLEGMKHVKSESGVILTKPFLDACKQILPVLDKFGGAMAVVKSDIGGNITRLENKFNSDPSKFENLYSMVQVEVEDKTTKSSSSCANGLLWLTRAMDFLVELFRNLQEHQDWTMSQVCTDSYSKTLKKWHGWLASSSFTVAMKIAPDRKKFMEVISGSGDINADMEKFCSAFSPLLTENHKYLASVGLDDMKAS
ncbi:glycolipid transfer protein 1 [Canna indica]|uniref:Glycolipid transfer protein 1 n=1 Tax=Canna indica TaxID=4628 RepID=A0AAQ3KKP1_9LILI|nr:glycolipid transfer protein 1 [Canna indica]